MITTTVCRGRTQTNIYKYIDAGCADGRGGADRVGRTVVYNYDVFLGFRTFFRLARTDVHSFMTARWDEKAAV